MFLIFRGRIRRHGRSNCGCTKGENESNDRFEPRSKGKGGFYNLLPRVMPRGWTSDRERERKEG